jgi:hypothetical protein
LKTQQQLKQNLLLHLKLRHNEPAHLALVDTVVIHLVNQVKQDQRAEHAEDSEHDVQVDEPADDLIALNDQNQNSIKKCLKSDG